MIRKTIKNKTSQLLFDELYAAGFRPSGTPKKKRKPAKPKNRGGVDEDRYLAEDEVDQMVEYVSVKAKRSKSGSKRALINEMIVLLLLTTGLRVAELCDLCLRDLPSGHGKPTIRVRSGKGNVSRSIDCPEMIVDRLPSFIKKTRPGARNGSRLFANERGGNLEPYMVRSKLEVIGNKIGINKLYPHKCRHTYLTDLYNTSYDIRYVQQQAGHSSMATTEIYTRTGNRQRRQQISGLRIVEVCRNLY